jgi:hypothetical protein
LLELRVTRITVNRDTGVLEVTWRRWWSPVRECQRHPIDGITRILLRDRWVDWQKKDVGIDYFGSRHNWELVAEALSEEHSLLPDRHASRFGAQRLGSALASDLGVQFHVEVHKAPLAP